MWIQLHRNLIMWSTGSWVITVYPIVGGSLIAIPRGSDSNGGAGGWCPREDGCARRMSVDIARFTERTLYYDDDDTMSTGDSRARL